MLDENMPAAVAIETEGVLYAMLVNIETLDCGSCGEHSGSVPAALVYSPKSNVYDALCLECALIMIQAARETLSEGRAQL